MDANGTQNEYTPVGWGVTTGYKCMYGCSQCMLSCKPSDDNEIPDELAEIFVMNAARYKTEFSEVSVNGGEPMLKPEKTLMILRKAKEYDLQTNLTSSFMGNTKDEVEKNACMLKEAGLDSYWGPVSGSHYKSIPKSIQMPYPEYMACIFDAMLKSGIEVFVKTTFDPENEVLLRSVGLRIFEIMGLAQTTFKEDFLAPVKNHYTEKYGTMMRLYFNDVMGIGNARKNGLSYGNGDRTSYICPEAARMPFAGTIELYPDGNVMPCCFAERGADLGFGNAKEEPFRAIIENIRNSRLLDGSFPERLKLAHKVMENEFPHMLPKNGPRMACEICSPMAAHPEVKERLLNEELFEGCF